MDSEAKEKKKNLNKKYYAEHKEDITAKLKAKERCECCDRTVVHQNITAHKATKYCKKYAQLQSHIDLLKQHGLDSLIEAIKKSV